MKIGIMGLIVFSDNGIQFNDKNLDFIDEFENAFRNYNDSLFFANGRPPHNAVTNHPRQMSQGDTVCVVIRTSLF